MFEADERDLVQCARGNHSYTMDVSMVGTVTCIHCRQVDPPTWMTVYAITREFGGPEEGGWYYDAGTVELNIPLHNYTLEDIVAMRTLLGKSFPRTHKSSSVMGGGDWTIVAAMRTGVNYPEERPHYE
jgi:hypothetical protein